MLAVCAYVRGGRWIAVMGKSEVGLCGGVVGWRRVIGNG